MKHNFQFMCCSHKRFLIIDKLFLVLLSFFYNPFLLFSKNVQAGGEPEIFWLSFIFSFSSSTKVYSATAPPIYLCFFPINKPLCRYGDTKKVLNKKLVLKARCRCKAHLRRKVLSPYSIATDRVVRLSSIF